MLVRFLQIQSKELPIGHGEHQVVTGHGDMRYQVWGVEIHLLFGKHRRVVVHLHIDVPWRCHGLRRLGPLRYLRGLLVLVENRRHFECSACLFGVIRHCFPQKQSLNVWNFIVNWIHFCNNLRIQMVNKHKMLSLTMLFSRSK